MPLGYKSECKLSLGPASPLARLWYNPYLMRKQVTTHEGYERWASRYDETSNPVVAADDRVLGELIGDVTGRIVLDAGCGTGRHTVRLAEQAARVIALDFSANMLAQTRAKLEQRGLADRVVLIEHDLAKPLPVGDHAVDVSVCALVGEHLSNLPAVFAELARVLRPGGRLVFSVYHPFLALAGKEANFHDVESNIEYRLGAHRHLCADYVNAALRAGLQLTELREVTAEQALRDVPGNFERYSGMLMLLALAAIVPASR